MSRAAQHARLLVIADDLSGAADCAAGFARHLPTRVLLTQDADAAGNPVMALDLDTRRLSADFAAQLNRAVLDNPLFAGRALYKKIDSTLRGNVLSEVSALLERGMALVAPAFPALGRTTLNSVQYVDGVPVDRSDVWRNEGLSGTADLLELFSSEGLKCAALGLRQMRDDDLAEQLQQHLLDGTQVLICDAEQDADLRNLALASARFTDCVFWVGSAGLALHLPVALGLPAATEPSRVQAEQNGPILTVVGSMSRHSQAQAALLAERTGQRWARIEPRVLLDHATDHERQALVLHLASVLDSGNDLLVSLDQARRAPEQAAQLSQALADLLSTLPAKAAALIATGGETARALLTVAGIDALQLQGELAPGVVLSSALHKGRMLPVVTKAGGFGQPDTLYQAWAHLRPAHDSRSVPTAPNTEEPQHV